jgi:uncharacterized protein (DUF924 family)
LIADGWIGEVLGFWFGLEQEQWWKVDPELDEEIRERFLPLWEKQAQRLVNEFLGDAETALAAIILFDQFPRNMFRGHADSFATDHMALAIAKASVDRGYHKQVDQARRFFFYMPFEHSEDREDQQQSVALFTELGDPELLRFAKLHHDIIERFGRFPHRNPILGRSPRPDEIAAGDVVPW